MPASRDGLGPFYRDVVAVDPLEPYGATSAAYRLELLAPALPFPVSGARLVPSSNNDVWRLEAGYLRVAWRGDRGRLAREAELLGRLRGVIPVPEVLDCGGDERLSWSLTTAVPGTPLDGLCTQPAPGGLRGIVAEAAGLLQALHSWPVPPDLDRRLWRYAIAYTLRHIIFWPPDHAEADGLDPGHLLHTLRRLIDAPLPLSCGQARRC